MDRTQKLIIAAACLFTLHNAEEWVAMGRWLNRFPQLNPAGLTAAQFGVAAALITFLGWAVLAVACRYERYRCQIIVAFTAIFGVNAFVPHIAVALMLRTYTPGLLTAAIAYIPFTVIAGRAIPSCGLTRIQIIESSAIGLSIGALATLVSLQISRYV